MDNKTNIPKIRFPGYTDPWEQRKLSDLYKDIGNAFVGTATPYYVEAGHFYLESNNIKDGQINHNTEVFINDEFYEKQKDKWLHTGDMVMVQSGHVGHSAVIPEELDCSAAHALIMFRNPKVEIEPYFLNYQYQTTKSKKKIENITTGNTIKHILASEMQEFVVDVTSYDEQKKIAGFFRDLDNLITLHQRKIDAIKEYKKGLLQKMFPRDGASAPELRFPGFSDPWEQRKFGDDIENIQTGTNLLGSTTNQGMPLLKMGNIQRGYFDVSKLEYLEDKDTIEPENIVYYGDFFFNTRNTLELVGKGATWTGESGKYAFNSNIARFKLRDIDTVFFNYLYNTVAVTKQIHARAMGTTSVAAIYPWTLDTVTYYLPTIEEQKQIGLYFNRLDNLITLHQREIDAMKEYKKGLLQRMFI